MSTTHTLDRLDPAARARVERYLDSVAAVLAEQDPTIVDEVLSDLRAHIVTVLAEDASDAALDGLLDELGDPSSYAQPSTESYERTTVTAGRLLGVPYDVRVPTAERIASRWWAPGDSRLFMPRVFGIGWDLNFGALAVMLRLVEPDSEDEPFGAVPDRAFRTALVVPVAMTAFIVASFVLLRRSLPAELPVHFGLSGAPDRYSTAMTAWALVLALSVLPTMWAVFSVGVHRSALNRGAVIGFASFMASLAASIWALTLMTAFGGPQAWWIPPVFIFGALIVPLAVLAWLSRVGSREERRRSMSVASNGSDGERVAV